VSFATGCRTGLLHPEGEGENAMNVPAGINAAIGLALGGWWLGQVDWNGAAEWLRVFLVLYGCWLMDP
jgi:hypothetical protein